MILMLTTVRPCPLYFLFLIVTTRIVAKTFLVETANKNGTLEHKAHSDYENNDDWKNVDEDEGDGWKDVDNINLEQFNEYGVNYQDDSNSNSDEANTIKDVNKKMIKTNKKLRSNRKAKIRKIKILRKRKTVKI